MLMRVMLFSCIFLAQISYSQAKLLPPTKSGPIRAFTAVKITGDINVNLHTGYASPAVRMSGYPEDLDLITLRVSNRGVLCIETKKNTHFKGPVSADIRTHYLNGLEYHGTGKITGKHLRANLERVVLVNKGPTELKGVLRLGYLEALGPGYVQMSGVISPHLHVKLSSQAKVKLTGIASLRRLDMDGTSWFSMSWVSTPTLIVRATGKAYIQLAGIVNKLDAEIGGFSQLNARYLRARRSFVKTHDNSVAKISTTEHQHTLATDASDIRLYNLPEMKTDFMAFDGAVLDFRLFNTAFVQEPTPYNK